MSTMLKFATFFFFFFAIASAAPASELQPRTCPVVQQNANFDDIPGSAVALTTFPPTPYRGLYFQAFNVLTGIKVSGVQPGVLPHSPPNYAAINAQSQTLQGTAMITTNYPNNNTSSFTLNSFYFGSALAGTTGAAGSPSLTNLEVTGYRGQDNQVSSATQVCSRQFQYNPSSLTGEQQMAFSGSISGCNDIQFLIITFSPVGGAAAGGAVNQLLLDDIKFSTKSC